MSFTPQPSHLKLWNELNSAFTIMEKMINVGEDPFSGSGFSKNAWQTILSRISRASDYLDNHPELDLREHPNLMAVFYTRDESNRRWILNQIPVAEHLYKMYVGFRLHSVRNLLIKVLHKGLDASTTSPLLVHRRSTLMSLLSEHKADIKLVEAFIHAGATVKPAILKGSLDSLESPVSTSQRGKVDTQEVVGSSLLHTFSTTLETSMLKKLFLIADELSDESDSVNSPDRVSNIDLVADAYKRMAASHRATDRADWVGHMYDVEYLSFFAVSPTFRELCRQWNENGATASLRRDITAKMSEDVMLYLLVQLLEHGRFDLREVAMQDSQNLMNFFHLVVLKHQSRLCARMLSYIFSILEPETQQEVHYRQIANASGKVDTSNIVDPEAVGTALWYALQQRERYLQRTPLQSAAAVYGKDIMYRQLLKAQRRLANWFNRRGKEQHYNTNADEDFVFTKLSEDIGLDIRDALGNTAGDYLTEGAANRSIPPNVVLNKVRAKTLNLFGDSHAMDSLLDKDSNEDDTKESTFKIHPDVDMEDPSAKQDGGWDVYGSRTDLSGDMVADLDPITGEVLEYHERCDILELHHMPSKVCLTYVLVTFLLFQSLMLNYSGYLHSSGIFLSRLICQSLSCFVVK